MKVSVLAESLSLLSQSGGGKRLWFSAAWFGFSPVFAASAFADGMEEPVKGAPPKSSAKPSLPGSGATPPVRQAAKTGNTSPLDSFELAKYQYCGKDSDCTVAVNGSCDCVNGGVEVAVNKERWEAFRARFDCLHVECTQHVADPPCENGVVSCVNHKCQYFDDRPVPGAEEPAPEERPVVRRKKKRSAAEIEAEKEFGEEPAAGEGEPASDGEIPEGEIPAAGEGSETDVGNEEIGAPEPYYE